MRYFKTAAGKILCTFLRPGNSRHEIMLRCDPVSEFPEYDPGFACYPSPEVPSERDHGPLVEISEAEAMQDDPGLFKFWTNYEDLKRLEPETQQAPAKKRRTVRESATIQATSRKGFQMNTLLLACKAISDQARQELKRAGCTIHKEVPGLDADIEIVELRHDGDKDLNVMFVWSVPREIEIKSKNLHLLYTYNEQVEGYELDVLQPY